LYSNGATADLGTVVATVNTIWDLGLRIADLRGGMRASLQQQVRTASGSDRVSLLPHVYSLVEVTKIIALTVNYVVDRVRDAYTNFSF
jgi:hypothetical protein